MIKECLGGVLFIDEAYALGNHEKRDSYSKECIDTLCEALSDHKHELIVIIAGYENELNECFFQYNQGLDSRFTWRFKTEPFQPEELYQIFLKKVKENGWIVDSEDQTLGSGWFQKKWTPFLLTGETSKHCFPKLKLCIAEECFANLKRRKKKLREKI